MSAIMGIFHRDSKPAEAEPLESMVDILRHRGSDSRHTWREGPVGLGNRMLWTTKSSCSERMPSWDAGRRCIITADCRLDNREELWRMVGREGHIEEETTDSALILMAYEHWGEKCPQYLLGDFAFAIWDSQKRQLFCARDHMGVRPFYYHCSGSLFAFGSEIKAVLLNAQIDRNLNEEWIGEFLIGQWLEKTHTIYNSIRRLEPSHALVVDRDHFRAERYWALDPDREIRYGSDEQYYEEFRSLFSDAVRCRLRGIHPVGSMLSGGLDSSSISCVARSLSRSNGMLHTLSAVFPHIPQCDETVYIKTVLDQGGVHPHCFDASRIGVLHGYERRLWHLDQPLTGYNGHLGWFLLGNARENGIRIVLDGTDGDSTVSYGSGFFRDLARGGSWGELLFELHGQHRVHGTLVWKPFLQAVWRSGFLAKVPMGVRRIWKSSREFLQKHDNSMEAEDPIWGWLAPGFIRRADLRGKNERARARNHCHSAREQHWKQISSNRLPVLLELLDNRAAAFGVEQRLPFCDKRLVEFCLAVPTRLKCHRGFDRYIMRHSLKDLLPREISERPNKADLTGVFMAGVREHDPDVWKEHLNGSLDAISDYIDPNALRNRCKNWQQAELNAMEMRAFWRSIIFAVWAHGKGSAI